MATRKNKSAVSDKQQQLVDEANNRYNLASSYWKPFFNKAIEEMEFITGDQWTRQARANREIDGRPVVQLPRIQNFVRQLQAQIRQSKLSIDVSANNNSNKNDADIVSSLIRKIESKSNADTAYDTAGESAIVSGFGVLRVYADYDDYLSFDQNIKIESIFDPTTVYFDPNSIDPVFSDAEYCFIESIMTRDEYAKKIGSSTKLSELAKLSGFSNSSPLIIDKEHILILEYYRKEYDSVNIYKAGNMITGEVIITTDIPDEMNSNWRILETRKTSKCKIIHALFDGLELHNEVEIEGAQQLPVVPVLGEQRFVNRKRYIKGAVRDSIDSQRIINYAASSQLEAVDLAPKTPWLVEEGSIEGYENEWRDANTRNYSYLVYKGKNGVPAPVRAPVNTDISSIASVKQQAENDMQAVFGIFNAALGQEGNENSGVAIKTRIEQTNQSTYTYKDNLLRSVKQIGKVMAQMIPAIYNGRIETLQSVDGSDKRIKIDINPLASFEISIKQSPSSISQREELNNDLLKLVQVMPSAAPLVADYLIKNSDLPQADNLIARLQTLLPPEVRQIEAQKGLSDNPQELKAKVMQSEQEKQQLNAAMQQIQMQMQQLQIENQQLKDNKVLEQQKIQLDAEKNRMDYDVKTKNLQLDATKLKLDFELSAQQQKLAEAKLASEAIGSKHDELPSVNL